MNKKNKKTKQKNDSEDTIVTSASVSMRAKRLSPWYLMTMGLAALVGIGVVLLAKIGMMDQVMEELAKNNYRFYYMLLAGFIAELIAGSMGMGYGVICTTILLFMNIPPSSVSASIHTAESFTSGAGALSHIKLRNVNKKLVKLLAIPAVVGAIAGAVLSCYLDEHYAKIMKPFVAIYTISLGVKILQNYLKKVDRKYVRKKTNIPALGIFGGFVDSFAGGGWGPLVTATFIRNGYTPRYVIGTSTVTNFIITIASSVTFFFAMEGVKHWDIVAGLLVGGIITAPFSAMLTSKLPVKEMHLIVGAVVVIMGGITLFRSVMVLL